MRLQQYILQESRSKQLDKQEAFSLIDKHCKDAVKAYFDGKRIYRGMHNKKDYLYIDPKKFVRKSKNNANYYTLINDNADCWKGYPKRSQSIICSTSVNDVQSYGNPYIVFPYDGAKIGVAPAYDYWYSFIDELGMSLDNFILFLRNTFKLLHIPLYDKSYKDMVKSFKAFDEYMKTHQLTLDVHKMLPRMDLYEGDLLKHLEELMCPDNNYFELKTIDKLTDNGVEVWTDSKSILISFNQSTVFENHFEK
jgi:hypothetical protein